MLFITNDLCSYPQVSIQAVIIMLYLFLQSTGSLVVNCFMHVFLHVIQSGGQKELQTVSRYLKVSEI